MKRIWDNGLKLNKKHSVRTIVALCFFSILIFQSIVISINFMLSKADDRLDKNAYQYILKDADDTCRQIERYMTNLWSNKNYMEKVINNLEKSNSLSSSGGVFVEKNTGSGIVDMMNMMQSDGAFVVSLNSDNQTNVVAHFRDLNVYTQTSDKSDITLVVGSGDIAKDMSVGLSSDWTPSVKSKLYPGTIYEKAMSKVISLSDTKSVEKGFWMSGFADEKESYIYYIVPLINRKTGNIFGVLGIEMGSSAIENILQFARISDSENSAYIIANSSSKDGENDKWKVIAKKGKNVDNIIDNNHVITKTVKNKYYDKNSSVKDNKFLNMLVIGKKKIFAIQRPIRLNGGDLHANVDSWSLLTIVDKSELESYSNDLFFSFAQMIIISIIIGLIAVYFVTKTITAPLKKLSEAISRYFENDGVQKFSKLNVIEIDNLTETIESLSEKLFANSRKFQKIMESVPVSMVAFETDLKENTVYKIGELSNILPEYMPYEKFEKKMSTREYSEWSKSFFADCETIENVFDVEKETQTYVIKKKWKNEIYYIKIVSKRVDNYALAPNTLYDESPYGKNPVVLQIMTDYTKEMTEILRIQSERDYDSLTGLFNRFSFKEATQKFIKSDISIGKKAAMIMWDLDNLKYVNDSFGHDKGDEYLKLAGKVLGTLREEGAYVARFSGDEFFVFMPYKEDKNEIVEKVNKIKEKLFESVLTISNNVSVKIRATAGISWYPDDSTKYYELKRFADFAMYSAKFSAKGNMAEFNKDLYEKNYILFSGKESLNEFIEEKQLKFAFQPIVSAKNGEIYGYEALIRPTSQHIRTVWDVMRLAKAQSKLVDIEVLTFEGALEYYSDNPELFEDKKLFINSIASVSIPKDKRNTLFQKYADKFSNVVVEIIESEDIDIDSMEIKQEMKRKTGCAIAIDDFGTGYATESRLLQINPDLVKIDMTLIRNIDMDSKRKEIVSNILRYAKELGIGVICEGVETYNEMKKLIEMGVDYIQGYYIAKPDFEIKDVDEDKKQQILELSGEIEKRNCV